MGRQGTFRPRDVPLPLPVAGDSSQLSPSASSTEPLTRDDISEITTREVEAAVNEYKELINNKLYELQKRISLAEHSTAQNELRNGELEEDLSATKDALLYKKKDLYDKIVNKAAVVETKFQDFSRSLRISASFQNNTIDCSTFVSTVYRLQKERISSQLSSSFCIPSYILSISPRWTLI